ncbi:hypothetical protein FA13DRAFT_1193720 [Coprinellus micaceus]|uniref:Uncharacterized protein n=1 Tax=Coprinellus micaceus TaxID=71717 RepID=A0A4Y7RBZ1_COPMI|nr:hypothetical protein FA13DRAFT_1193720 [Coprinellus micaceus]
MSCSFPYTRIICSTPFIFHTRTLERWQSRCIGAEAGGLECSGVRWACMPRPVTKPDTIWVQKVGHAPYLTGGTTISPFPLEFGVGMGLEAGVRPSSGSIRTWLVPCTQLAPSRYALPPRTSPIEHFSPGPPSSVQNSRPFPTHQGGTRIYFSRSSSDPAFDQSFQPDQPRRPSIAFLPLTSLSSTLESPGK